MDDADFTIPYITGTIPNSPFGHKLPKQDKRNAWVVAINGEEPIIYQCALDELNRHQIPRGKYKVNISLYRRKSYQITYLEGIHSIFDQVRPVVSHLQFSIPNKPATTNNIGEVLKGS